MNFFLLLCDINVYMSVGSHDHDPLRGTVQSPRRLWRPSNQRAGTPSDFPNVLEIQEFSEIEPLVAGMQVVEIEPIQWHSMSL